MSVATIEGVAASLSPEQRERLARLNEQRGGDPRVTTILRSGVKPSKPAGSERWRTVVQSSSRRDLNRVTITFKGLVLVSEANEREHWHTRRARKVFQQDLVRNALAQVSKPAGPWLVTIQRGGPRRLDDDNLQGSAKHLRDGIAFWCGVDDGDRARFRCAVTQELGDYVVRVTIEGSAW